jgi:hypothetical protein
MEKTYRMTRFLSFLALFVSAAGWAVALDDAKAEFTYSLPVAPTEHIILDVSVPAGDVTISFARPGEILVGATARGEGDHAAPRDFFQDSLKVEKDGNHVLVRFVPSARYAGRVFKVAYTISVPNWIEVNSTVGNGRQSVLGVMGPVKLESGSGDIKTAYITTTLEARTGNGNIDVVRVGAAARVETGAGNISLREIGPGSIAAVKQGTGRIELDGISGSFTGTTVAGELDVKGAAYGDWDLRSMSGNIRVGVAKEFKYEIDAATSTGQIIMHNEDVEGCGASARTCHEKVNGGGKVVRARTKSGNISID